MTSSQPLIATIPFLASIPTAILSSYFSTANLTKSGFLRAEVPKITLAIPAFKYLSTHSILRIPPPTSTGILSSDTIVLMSSKFGISPDFAPSKSTI